VTDNEYNRLFETYSGKEGDLIPLLQDVQEKEGYVSEQAVEKISEFLNITDNQIFGVASFYSQFRFNRPGKHAIKACLGTACHVRNGQILVDAMETELGRWPAWAAAPWLRSFR
jgi:NADH-quinone oxidoreductase subunit E